MRPTDRQNLLDVLDELLQLPREQRCARMDELGLSDPDRSSVETWLKYHDSSDSFLENIPRECIRLLFGEVESADAAHGSRGTESDAGPAPHVSGYEVKELLGQGGMANVWRARQLGTRRDVALKMMNPVLFVSARARARFDRELRITAHLRHPNIAAVYDGGTSDGVCFYAMELVEGEPLDQFVRSHKLSRRQILELMLKVCEAVRHAHQNGVIHRDLKPSNILVDRAGQPRVLDFGLAKALAEVGPEITVSQEGDLAGTPAYMSPEQASGGGNVDTRSDVYSLGVILYRLLTGHPPHDLSGSRFQVLQRISSEEIRSPRVFDTRIDRDLEAMLLKALAREPQQRYATAAELAEDLSRYLRGEPLIAHLPTLRYLLAKRLRRHWLGATAAAAVTTILLGTAIFSYISIAQERTKALASAERADQEAAIATAVNDFLNKDVLGQASPSNQATPEINPNRNLTVREAVDRAAVRIADQFDGRPIVKAKIHQTIGNTYAELGESAQSEQHLAEALRLMRQHAGDEAPDTLTAQHCLALLYSQLGRHAESEALFKHALEAERRVRGNEDAQTLNTIASLGQLYLNQDRFADAEPFLIEALETNRRVLGARSRETLLALNGLAVLYFNQGKYDKAEPLYLEALDGMRQVMGDQHPDTLHTLSNLGVLYSQQRHYKKAAPYLLEAFEVSKKVYGENHHQTFFAMEELGQCYMSQQRLSGDTPSYGSAEKLLSDALQGLRQTLGAEHRITLTAMQRLALIYLFQEQHAKAKPLLLEALDVQLRTLGELHQSTLNTMNDLAYVYEVERDFANAAAMYLRCWQGKKQARGPSQQSTLVTLSNLCGLLLDLEKYDRAEPLLLEGLEAARLGGAAVESEHDEFHFLLADLYYRRAEYSRADPLLAALCEKGSAKGTLELDREVRLRGLCLSKLGRNEEALPCLRDAYERLKSNAANERPRIEEILATLAEVCSATNRPDEAAKWRAELAALQASTQPSSAPSTQPASGPS